MHHIHDHWFAESLAADFAGDLLEAVMTATKVTPKPKPQQPKPNTKQKTLSKTDS